MLLYLRGITTFFFYVNTNNQSHCASWVARTRLGDTIQSLKIEGPIAKRLLVLKNIAIFLA